MKNNKGEIIAELPLYESLYQVPLNRYIDFLKAIEQLDDLAKLEAGELNIPRIFAKAIGAFFGLPFDQTLQANYGDFDGGQLDGGLQNIYRWIVELIGKFQTGQKSEFTYKGERFVMPQIGLQTLNALPLLPNLETGEVIEAWEIRRIAYKQIEEGKDPDGSYLYSYYLQLLAVLFRKEDEKLPVGDSETEIFINERAAYFQEIDAGTALEIDFFLPSLIPQSGKTGAIIGFLSNRALDLVLGIQKLQGLSKKPLTGLPNEAGRISKKRGGANSISSYWKGGGSKKRVKVPSKQ